MEDICKPDKRSELFDLTKEQIRVDLSKVPVSDKVPQNIREMLEFTDKICLYGYYEYDFYTLSSIYLFLLAETAIKERLLSELPSECTLIKKEKTKKIRKGKSIFQYLRKGWKIEDCREVSSSPESIAIWLKKNRILPERIGDRQISLLVQLRNDAAHLTAKDIYMPTQVIPMIWLITDFINCLFDPQVHDKEPDVLVRTKESYRQISEIAKRAFEERK